MLAKIAAFFLCVLLLGLGLGFALRPDLKQQTEELKPFVADLIESVRNNTDLHRSYLTDNTAADLEHYRSMMSDSFEIVSCDWLPGFTFNAFECLLRFSNGTTAWLDISRNEKAVVRAHLWGTTAEAPR